MSGVRGVIGFRVRVNCRNIKYGIEIYDATAVLTHCEVSPLLFSHPSPKEHGLAAIVPITLFIVPYVCLYTSQMHLGDAPAYAVCMDTLHTHIAYIPYYAHYTKRIHHAYTPCIFTLRIHLAMHNTPNVYTLHIHRIPCK